MRFLYKLRVEEVIALLFLLPTSYLTVAANLLARREGVLGQRHAGGLLRLGLALLLLGLLLLLVRRFPRARAVIALREVLPFLTCILIYTNLHDTIGLVNSHDVHFYLAALDETLVGVEPTVWAERFISRDLTEWMRFFYLSFFWIAPAPSLLLLARGRWREFRATTMAVVVCFYLGYLLYLIFPAAPPRLVLLFDYTRSLDGYPRLFSNLEADVLSLLPIDSRAAFPSLHAAVSLVAFVCAWRYARRLSFALLPFVIALSVSTIYLRHHYLVDLIAGWMLAPVALWVAPRLDRAWTRRQHALGCQAALGAPGLDEVPSGDESPRPRSEEPTTSPA
jgi:membrane-associated phospholipid phosphatase